MTRPKNRWRGALTLATAVLGVLALAACGDCCHHDDVYVYGGTLEVVNDPASVEGIEHVDISVPGGPIETHDVFLAPGDSAFIDLYPDLYDVDVIWSDTTMDSFLAVEIFDHATTTIVATN